MSSGPLTNSSTLSTNGALGIPRGFVYLLVSIHLHTDRIRDILSFRLCHGRQTSRKAKCVADDQLVIFKISENQSLLQAPPPTSTSSFSERFGPQSIANASNSPPPPTRRQLDPANQTSPPPNLPLRPCPPSKARKGKLPPQSRQCSHDPPSRPHPPAQSRIERVHELSAP